MIFKVHSNTNHSMSLYYTYGKYENINNIVI